MRTCKKKCSKSFNGINKWPAIREKLTYTKAAGRKTKIAALSGIAAALFLHALVYFAAPDRFAEYETATRGGDELKLEILPPEISKRPPEFVEANPFANTEKPDSPDAPDSFTDQRASDIIPDPSSKSKMPYVEGEIKDGKKIVEGTSSRKTYSIRNNPFKLSEAPRTARPRIRVPQADSGRFNHRGGIRRGFRRKVVAVGRDKNRRGGRERRPTKVGNLRRKKCPANRQAGRYKPCRRKICPPPAAGSKQ